MLDCSRLPVWLEAMFSEKFYKACIFHDNFKKNQKNIFCLDCCEAICPHCLANHCSHHLLQIRRYIYNDVLRVKDAEKLIDCSFIQSYITNGAKVMFINERPQTHPWKATTNICTSCERTLQHTYHYCCLSCKLKHILRTEGRLTKNHIFGFEGLSFPELGFNGGLMTPVSVLELAGSNRSESSSSGPECVFACIPTSEVVVRKKRSSVPPYRAVCRPVISPTKISGGRRKNTPHRSPLY